MKNTHIPKLLRRMFGLPKMGRNDRLIDAGEYSTNGFIMLKKRFEPRSWKSKRFTQELEKEQADKLIKKYDESMHVLEVDDIVAIGFETPIAMKCDHHTSFVNPQYIGLLTDIMLFEKTPINLDTLEFVQGDDPMGEIFIRIGTDKDLIGLVMPFRPSDRLKEIYGMSEKNA